MLQGGLIGLLRGIEKFDASRGFRISTYVYWWIRQVRLLMFLCSFITIFWPLKWFRNY
jgi:DNA-directed RNA polymerase specialized sigma subunit